VEIKKYINLILPLGENNRKFFIIGKN